MVWPHGSGTARVGALPQEMPSVAHLRKDSTSFWACEVRCWRWLFGKEYQSLPSVTLPACWTNPSTFNPQPSPLSIEHGTHKTVKARFWPWFSGKGP